MPKYINEILNWFNIETPRKGSCRMEAIEARLGVFTNTWWAKRMSDLSIMYSMLCAQSRYVLCYKELWAYTRVTIWWSLDKVSIFFSTLEELKTCVVCGIDKRFIVKYYNDTSLVIDTNKFISIRLYVYNKGGAMG